MVGGSWFVVRPPHLGVVKSPEGGAALLQEFSPRHTNLKDGLDDARILLHILEGRVVMVRGGGGEGRG